MQIASKLKSYALIFCGVVLLSASIGLFCVPNKIVSGGVSGISIILFYLFKIPVGISYYAVNIIFLVILYVPALFLFFRIYFPCFRRWVMTLF